MRPTHLPAVVLAVTLALSARTLAEGASPVTRDITFLVLSDVLSLRRVHFVLNGFSGAGTLQPRRFRSAPGAVL
ncbi:MAG TPA: hypothetical protein PK640_00950 [Verrucomicrobiota bacterium]|nr:hypothetical protein [Verrucomicrobiota bacterium]